MARILTEQDFADRVKSILEYTQAMTSSMNDDILNEADPTQEDPNADMGGDPGMGGEMGGEDPNATMGDTMGGAMGGEDPNADMGGGDAAMGGQGVEGLAPQGDAAPMPEEGGESSDIENMEEGDEVIDVDELTGYQKRTAKGVGEVSDEIKALKDLIIKFQEKVEANNQGLESLQREIEKRVPSQEEKLNLRKKTSSPFNQGIEDYWDNDAPENYSIEDDNNGEGNPKYQITKSDVDGIDNWNEIARSFDDMAELNSLRNIFNF